MKRISSENEKGKYEAKLPKMSPEYDKASQENVDLTTKPQTYPSSCLESDANVKMPKYVEVKCGSLYGRLHTERFICPGIREPCIDTLDSPGVLLTPVEFTVKAEKSKQKDWKGAIKHDGRMLRTLMETKHLDFYNHHEQCSFKCHSRNYITKNSESTSKPQTTSNVNQVKKRRQSTPSALFLQDKQLSHAAFLAAITAQWNAENHKRQEKAEQMVLQKQKAIKDLMENDAVTFWNQAIQSKISDLIISTASRELGAVVQNISLGQNFESSSVKMNKILDILGISDSLCRAICGEFVMPQPTLHVKLEGDPSDTKLGEVPNSSTPLETLPILSIQDSGRTSLNHSNNNNILSLSSSEKLELMIKNSF